MNRRFHLHLRSLPLSPPPPAVELRQSDLHCFEAGGGLKTAARLALEPGWGHAAPDSAVPGAGEGRNGALLVQTRPRAGQHSHAVWSNEFAGGEGLTCRWNWKDATVDATALAAGVLVAGTIGMSVDVTSHAHARASDDEADVIEPLDLPSAPGLRDSSLEPCTHCHPPLAFLSQRSCVAYHLAVAEQAVAVASKPLELMALIFAVAA